MADGVLNNPHAVLEGQVRYPFVRAPVELMLTTHRSPRTRARRAAF